MGIPSTTMTSEGTIMSAAPFDLAYVNSCARAASACSVSSTMRSPLRASATLTATLRASGHRPAASPSTALSETISPAILAKRLARSLMVTNPCGSIETMSPVSCQPSGGGSRTVGFSTRKYPSITLGPLTNSRPPSSSPGTGSSRAFRPGSSRPTVPDLLYIGVLSAKAGAASVTP
jgi:hypothetical protein